MKRMPEEMHAAVVAEIEATRRAANVCMDLINRPEGRKPETLEDALNELQDRAFQARRAFRPGAIL